MRRFLVLFVLLPLAIIIVVLSVANREAVTFSLDPVSTVPKLAVTAPLFFFLFGALGLGILLGGIATWVGQGRWRRAARSERANATRLRDETERLRERVGASTPALPGPRRDAA